MKKINFLVIVLLIVVTALVSSCKKEAKIEKNLWNKGGEWNIESRVIKITSTIPSLNFNKTFYNWGTYTFKKDGNGNYTITVNGSFETGTLTYSNTEDKLTLIINNQARVFDILEWEKDKMKIINTENITSGEESITNIQIFNLKKK